ncbi:hypothetical protein AOLI_G00017240 [Acnodon oligacanthus]
MDPEGLQVYILDFGCGNVLTEDPYTSYYGTPDYTPPECFLEGSYQESSRQEAPHSTGDLSAPVSPQDLRMDPPDANPKSQPHPVREQIKWPKMSNNKQWYQLDHDLDKMLEATLAGTAEQKAYIPKEDVEALLKETNNDTRRNQVLDANPSINSTKILEKELSISEPSWKKVQEVLKNRICPRPKRDTLRDRLRRKIGHFLYMEADLEKGYYAIMLEESRGLFRARGRELLNH